MHWQWLAIAGQAMGLLQTIQAEESRLIHHIFLHWLYPLAADVSGVVVVEEVADILRYSCFDREGDSW